MGKFFSRPVTEAEKQARDQKRQAQAEAVRKTEQDLIIAELLSKISKLEAKSK